MDKPGQSGSRVTRANLPLRWASNLCLVAGVVALAMCLFVWAEAHIFQASASRDFDSEAKISVAQAEVGRENPVSEKTLSSSQGIQSNSVVGRLVIDRLGISVVVLQGVDDRALRIAAGHVPDTALPGHPGNVAIAAHRDTFFRPLRNIRKDDKITLETPTASYQYEVETTQIVGPQRTEVLNPTPYPSLTLITCYPFYYVGNAPDRFIVQARQISTESGDGHRSAMKADMKHLNG